MIAVALHPFSKVFVPHICPRSPAGPCHSIAPFVVKFVDHKNTFLIGEAEESL